MCAPTKGHVSSFDWPRSDSSVAVAAAALASLITINPSLIIIPSLRSNDDSSSVHEEHFIRWESYLMGNVVELNCTESSHFIPSRSIEMHWPRRSSQSSAPEERWTMNNDRYGDNNFNSMIIRFHAT